MPEPDIDTLFDAATRFGAMLLAVTVIGFAILGDRAAFVLALGSLAAGYICQVAAFYDRTAYRLTWLATASQVAWLASLALWVAAVIAMVL